MNKTNKKSGYRTSGAREKKNNKCDFYTLDTYISVPRVKEWDVLLLYRCKSARRAFVV